MDIAEKIKSIVEPSTKALGYLLVQVKLVDSPRRKTLTIMAERSDGQSMGFDDCTEISQTVSALLEVEDPITGAYNLEVCSPGLDRPLTSLEDFTRFAGLEAKVEMLLPVNARKRFRGIIQGLESGKVVLVMPEGEAMLPYNQIRSAKLAVDTQPSAKQKHGKKPKHENIKADDMHSQ